MKEDAVSLEDAVIASSRFLITKDNERNIKIRLSSEEENNQTIDEVMVILEKALEKGYQIDIDI